MMVKRGMNRMIFVNLDNLPGAGFTLYPTSRLPTSRGSATPMFSKEIG